MGVREAINKNSVISAVAIAAVLIFAVVVIALELKTNKGEPPKYCYYTIDDGKTWFSDNLRRLPPFDHDGSPAVRCFVFQGPNGKFAGLLEKLSDDVRAKLAQNGDQIPPLGTPVMVKKPGESKWTSMGVEQESMLLLQIVGRQDSGIEPVMP